MFGTLLVGDRHEPTRLRPIGGQDQPIWAGPWSPAESSLADTVRLAVESMGVVDMVLLVLGDSIVHERVPSLIQPVMGSAEAVCLSATAVSDIRGMTPGVVPADAFHQLLLVSQLDRPVERSHFRCIVLSVAQVLSNPTWASTLALDEIVPRIRALPDRVNDFSGQLCITRVPDSREISVVNNTIHRSRCAAPRHELPFVPENGIKQDCGDTRVRHTDSWAKGIGPTNHATFSKMRPTGESGSSSKPVRISAIVPVRDRDPDILAACLRSIRAIGPTIIEILVVDFGSTSEYGRAYRDILRQAPHVRLVKVSTSAAWNKSAAVNVGACFASAASDYYLLSDSDLVFTKAIAHAMECISSRHLVCGYRHDVPEVAQLCTGPEVASLSDWATLTAVRSSLAIPWVIVPCWWYMEVGGFDERFSGRGYMDCDLAKRATVDLRIKVTPLKKG